MIAYSNYIADARIKREAATLAVNGYEVSVMALAYNGSPGIEMVDNIKLIKLNISKYQGQSHVRYILSYLFFLLRSMAVCSKLALKRKIDIVHVHNMPNFLVFAGLLPRILGKKVILDIHDSMIETYSGKFGKLPWWLYWLLFLEEKISVTFAHRIICVNHVQLQPLLNRGISKGKITVLLNVPDDKIFNSSVRSNPKADIKHFNIVYHGTLDRALGVDLAFRAVNRIRQDIPTVRLNVFGQGKDQDMFTGMIKELNLESNVVYEKKLFPVHEIPKMLHEMHVGLIPNRNNVATQYMLPVKLLEYVSLGIPVVVPRLDAIRYYFDESSAGYYEPENLDDMVRALLVLYGSPEIRQRQIECAFKMLDKFGWSRHQLDLLDLYAGLTRKKKQ